MLTVIETLDEISRGTSPLIYFSRYRADRVDNGGARRVAQLRQILAGYEVEFVSSQARQELLAVDEGATSGNGLFEWALQEAIRMLTRKYSAEFGRWIFFSDRLARRWVRALKKRQPPRLVLVDDPIFFPSLIRFCSEQGIPVVAFCQNIETLSRGQVVPRHQKELLLYELSLLGQCRAVVTIASEEAFLLRNLGQAVIHLPYYPPDAIEEQLLAIRQRRMTTDKRDFILLGSAGNAPTREGMARLLAAWRTMGDLSGERLLVVGYGTEVLRDASSMSGVEFCGAISDEALADLLGRIRGGIVYQEHGAGALTRIGEYLLAGVPVLANIHALRSYRNLAGTVELASLDDLPSALTSFLSGAPSVPLPPHTAATPLRELLDTVLQGN